jgi:hypothetical protein
LAEDLRAWIAEKPEAEAGPEAPLFKVPTGLLRILNRDLKAAGIPKKESRGRTIDIHALRHTFGTMLSAAGVRPRTAQEAMRHSTLDLTMNVYTHPALLDVAGAVESLPSFTIGGGRRRPSNPRRLRSKKEAPRTTPRDCLPPFLPLTCTALGNLGQLLPKRQFRTRHRPSCCLAR